MNFAINEEPPAIFTDSPAAPAPVAANKLMERVEALEEFAKVMLQTYQITYPNSPAPYTYTGQSQNLINQFVRE
jgi:hypothetical protein